jgi:ribosomal protein S18 acetylase RimI-like enzyme
MAASTDKRIRALGADDLERVIAIDRAHTGHARRRFFEKRFNAATAHPEDFVLVGTDDGIALSGYALARLLDGEFGREHSGATLDALGVAPENQEHGIGQILMEGLVAALRERGVRWLQSQADWKNHGVMRFFDASGFALAPRVVLERPAAEVLAEPIEEP